MSQLDVQLATPRETLRQILGALSPDPFVEGVSIGGSFARGEADEVSDLDLWIEGKWWQPESLGGLFLTAQQMKLGGTPFLHGVTVGGTILDIMYGPPAKGHYVDLELPDPQPLPQAPLPTCGLVEEFWLNTLKHRKNLWRGRAGVLVYGLNFDRRFLLRGWVLTETGTDPGDQAFSIFALKDLYDRHVNAARLELLGLPLRNLDEILYATEAYRDEMTRLFPDETLLEATVRAMPLLRS
jgi:nucleotidyltransferase-like protein